MQAKLRRLMLNVTFRESHLPGDFADTYFAVDLLQFLGVVFSPPGWAGRAKSKVYHPFE